MAKKFQIHPIHPGATAGAATNTVRLIRSHAATDPIVHSTRLNYLVLNGMSGGLTQWQAGNRIRRLYRSESFKNRPYISVNSANAEMAFAEYINDGPPPM